MAANHRRKKTRRTKAHTIKIGDDLVIVQTLRRHVAGTWVKGTIAGHRFDALVFPEHAEYPDYELGDSRISKLLLQSAADYRDAAHFDRGWDIHPTTKISKAIVDFLAANLAKHVYGK